MSVSLVISEVAGGAEVSDSLQGGGSGLDLGQVVNGAYAPVTDQAGNVGHQNLFISHNATVDPVTDVGLYLGQFSQTYGGANSAALDITTLLGLGAADGGATKNNSDGLSRGLRVDMDWQTNPATQFGYDRETTGQLRIFGKAYGTGPALRDGATQAKSFLMHQDAMSYWNGTTEVDATTPVAGKIGKSTDTVLGNQAHFKMRIALATAESEGGVVQVDFKIVYSYTA